MVHGDAQTKTYLNIFVRSLGIVYVLNFSSILQQVVPLIGAQGIAPIALTQRRTLELGGNSSWIFWCCPSIYWFNDSDNFLVSSVVVGLLAALSLVSCLGHSRLCLCTCWIVLLSLCSSGGEFFSFPWDWLLLEATFLSFFLPVLDEKGHLTAHVDVWARYALIFLCLRFYGGMAVEKLPSVNNNPYWRNFTYLSRFYETEQPMPTWIAWYAHNLPMWFHQCCCGITFVLELLSPLLGLCWRPALRNVGAMGMIIFQIPILMTGNYAILNILTIVMCIPLFEFDTDQHMNVKAGGENTTSARLPHQVLPAVCRAILLVHGFVGFVLLLRTIESLDYLSNTRWIFDEHMFGTSVVSLLVPRQLLMVLSAWKVSNGYGGVFHDSFQHEGKVVLKLQSSVNGYDWEDIEWRWHVHDPDRPPAFVAPHFPRLDHTVFYFANDIAFNQLNALHPFANGGMADLWFASFVQKLLEHDEHVWSLVNPSDRGGKIESVRFLRAYRELYRFTTNTSTDAWWTITQRQVFMPPVCVFQSSSCGRQNCVAMCTMLIRNVEHCETLVEQSNCRLPLLHNFTDPSSVLFVNEEFLSHWIHALPNAYLESWLFLYQLRADSKTRHEGEGEVFSDGKLLRWALGVYNECLRGGKSAVKITGLCRKLLL